MSTATRKPSQAVKAPAPLRKLAARFDAEAIDLPGGSARIRLAAGADSEWDALVSEAGVELVAAETGAIPTRC